MDDWYSAQKEKDDKELMEKYGLKDQDEINEFLLDRSNKLRKGIYDAGFQDGFSKSEARNLENN